MYFYLQGVLVFWVIFCFVKNDYLILELTEGGILRPHDPIRIYEDHSGSTKAGGEIVFI